MNIADARKALRYLSPDQPILLVGPPGVGKSEIVASYAAERSVRCIIAHPVISDPTDFKGLPAVVGGRAKWLPAGDLARICVPDCPETIVFLDDLGQAPAAVQAACMQLVLARRLGDHAISDRVSFVGATNRTTDASGVRQILAALINRMMMITIAPDPRGWATWAIGDSTIAPLVPAYARFRDRDLFATEPPRECAAFCTPRSLAQMGRLYTRGCSDHELLSGLVGSAIAADFLAFSEIAAKLPDVDTLLRDPRGWRRPTDPGLLHAIVCLAARRAETQAAGIVRLAEVLGAEWGTALCSDATSVFPAFRKTREFAGWAAAHPELL